jgi:hypothetical protein
MPPLPSSPARWRPARKGEPCKAACLSDGDIILVEYIVYNVECLLSSDSGMFFMACKIEAEVAVAAAAAMRLPDEDEDSMD